MKLDKTSSASLREEIKRRFNEKGLSYAEIGGMASVHPSQVSRICRGEFRTLSYNVVQICKALDLPIDTAKVAGGEDAMAKQLEERLHQVWNRTASDGKRLLKFLDSLADLRRSAGKGPAR